MSNKNEAILNELDKHSAYVSGKIQRGIEENRKGLFRLRFTETPDSEVKINQVNHEFKFGMPLFVFDQLDSDEKNALYKTRFLDIFNYAVMPLYWMDLEPERGKYRYTADSPFIWRRPPLDLLFDFCKENNIRTKGHCLAYNSFNPDWIKGLSNRELNMAMEERMASLSERYGSDFLDMDVINEMFTIYNNCYKGSNNGMRDLAIAMEPKHTDKMFRMAKRYFPYTTLYWNEGVDETFGRASYKGPRSMYYMMLDESLKRGIPIEGIGIQYHMYMTDGTANPNGIAFCNPLRLMDALDCYSDFKLPISISEISITTVGDDEEAELIQAEVAKKIYSIFFSQKYVDSMVWWNLADGMAYGGEGRFKAGLLNNDLSIKPSYQALMDLIHNEWHTELSTAVEDVTEFIGFYGDYDISYTVGGRPVTQRVKLYKENTGYDNRTMNPREIVVGE